MSSWCGEVANLMKLIKKAQEDWFLDKWILNKDECRHLKLINQRLELQKLKDEKVSKVADAIRPFLGGMPAKEVDEMAIALLGVAEPIQKDNDIYPPHEHWWYEDSTIHSGMVSELLLRQELRDVFYDCMECEEFYEKILPLFRDKDDFTLIKEPLDAPCVINFV